MSKARIPEELWPEHRKKFLHEYWLKHQEEIKRRKHDRWLEKKYLENAPRCQFCGEPIPRDRENYHYCSKEHYLQAFQPYRVKVGT